MNTILLEYAIHFHLMPSLYHCTIFFIYFFVSNIILQYIDTFLLNLLWSKSKTYADNCNILQLWDIGTENQIAERRESVYITEQRELQDTLGVRDMENSCETVLILGVKIWHVIIKVSEVFFTHWTYMLLAVIVLCVCSKHSHMTTK